MENQNYILFEIGQWLRHKRRLSSLSRKAVSALKPEISEEQLLKFETGKGSIPGFLFLKLARLYKVDDFEVWAFIEKLRQSYKKKKEGTPPLF